MWTYHINVLGQLDYIWHFRLDLKRTILRYIFPQWRKTFTYIVFEINNSKAFVYCYCNVQIYTYTYDEMCITFWGFWNSKILVIPSYIALILHNARKWFHSCPYAARNNSEKKVFRLSHIAISRSCTQNIFTLKRWIYHMHWVFLCI